jgi:hypothetical protein
MYTVNLKVSIIENGTRGGAGVLTDGNRYIDLLYTDKGYDFNLAQVQDFVAGNRGTPMGDRRVVRDLCHVQLIGNRVLNATAINGTPRPLDGSGTEWRVHP